MSEANNVSDHFLDHLPEELRQNLLGRVGEESLLAVSPVDLDECGRYIEAYLTLTEESLDYFIRRGDRWEEQVFPLKNISDALLVEGLGMSLLRLVHEGKTRMEFRYTLRHAKAVARLHRQLESLLGADEEALAALDQAPRPDEKKLRCEKCNRPIPAWSEVCPACMSRRKILFRLLDFVKPYRFRAITGVVTSVVGLVLSLVLPYLAKPMLDRGLGGGETAPDWPFFLQIWCVMAGLIFIISIGRGLEARMMAGLGSRVSRDLRQAIYSHLHRLSLSFFTRKQTGGLVSRVTHDSERLWDFIAFTTVEGAISLLTIASIAVVLFFLHWQLALFVMLPIPLMVGMMIFFHKRMHGIFHRIWHRWSQMTAIIGDALPGVRVIKAFGQEDREIDRFEKQSGRVYDEELTMINLWTSFGPLMQFCTQIGMLIIWILGGWWVIQNYNYTQAHGYADPNGMTLGTLMAFTGYMNMFYRPIHTIAHMDRMFNRAATSAQRIFDILDTEPAIFSRSGAYQPEKFEGAIELRNVSFTYDGIRRVLKNVDIQIKPGEMIGLAGPSGGGKTTMTNLICRFYDVLDGQILIDGRDVRDYDLTALRNKIGVVLQEPFLFHGTVAENIAYGRPVATMEEIIAAARAANAHDFIVGFPDGYDTLVGERGHSLSGGERQRISIARAIMGNPSILILDEATSSVDTETEKLIQEAMDRLIANRTTIAIAHRLSTLRKADRLIVLDKGKIVEQGTHEELMKKDGGLYAKLLRLQVEMQSIVSA